jgi:hypothetical protein
VPRDETVFFNAGNHIQTVRLKYKGFPVPVIEKKLLQTRRS